MTQSAETDALRRVACQTLSGQEMCSPGFTASGLGGLEEWPSALRAQLLLVMACPTPMFLAWGPDLACFYNDAYRPVLGYRLETALGRRFREVWATIWDDIGPLVEKTLAGEATVMTDMKLDLSREGSAEESWWTFTYSPAYDSDGSVAGLFCVTGETTPRVIAERERDEVAGRLELSLSAGNSIGTWDWDVVKDWVTADGRFASLYGVDPEKAAKGAPIANFFAGIHPEDLPRVQDEIAVAVGSGGTFISEYRLLHADGTTRWVSAQGKCLLDDQGRCVRFPGVSFDVTDRKLADIAIRAAKDERDFVISLTAKQRALKDPEAIIRLSSETLGQRLGVHRVGFYRLLSQDRMRHSGNWADGNLAPLLGEHPVSTFGRRAEVQRRSGKTLVFSDSRHEENGDLAPYYNGGVLSGVCVPLMDAGRWSAGIYAHHAEVRHWTASEVSLVKEIAELTWLAVERAEALVRLNTRIDRQEVELDGAAQDLVDSRAGRADAEGQVRQLQKMEAVGQLTGGIAHDFNNMLAIIIGGLNLTQRRLARGDTDVIKYIDNAMEGANRAAELTKRLLAFSRQQPLSPEAIDGNRLVQNLSELLARSLGEAVRLETVLGAGLWKTNLDPNQLENAIVNLAVNARDAMPDGGKLTIETTNAHVEDDYARDADIAPGQYVVFAVTDTGSGMSPDVLAKAFDPFFTTKGVGKGTGLGLSQVFGFVRQSHGHVRAYSEPGHGTTFRMYFPRFWGEETPVARKQTGPSKGGHSHEVIMVVEDEDRVRSVTVDALRELGYTVVHASSGSEALGLIRKGQAMSLLFTDIVMPEMTGRQLADELHKSQPELKVIYTTGYTRNAVVHNGILDPGTNFLAKPFTIDQLAAKLRQVLDSE
ncbi:MAG: response regulator [Asticcacaulis sp.]|uniref:ATP-binding protein n=1 Tax=Asticcacaulis sp. TaxID=1872648 RepID=UPI0039E26561